MQCAESPSASSLTASSTPSRRPPSSSMSSSVPSAGRCCRTSSRCAQRSPRSRTIVHRRRCRRTTLARPGSCDAGPRRRGAAYVGVCGRGARAQGSKTVLGRRSERDRPDRRCRDRRIPADVAESRERDGRRSCGCACALSDARTPDRCRVDRSAHRQAVVCGACRRLAGRGRFRRARLSPRGRPRGLSRPSTLGGGRLPPRCAHHQCLQLVRQPRVLPASTTRLGFRMTFWRVGGLSLRGSTGLGRADGTRASAAAEARATRGISAAHPDHSAELAQETAVPMINRSTRRDALKCLALEPERFSP